MSLEYSQLRQFVLDHLRMQPNGDINMIGGGFVRIRAEQAGLGYTDADGKRALEIFHELYREGVIVSGSGPNSGNYAMGWPFYRVTEYGRQVLEQKDYVPHDPDGYLERLRQEVPNVDAAIIRYLEEALGCFKVGHLLAAAVMTGCAAEKAMLLLIDVFDAALTDPNERAKFDAVIRKHWMIGRKYEELWKRLEGKLGELPNELADDLHVVLDRVFDLIRATRNAAGHPTGKQIDRNTVRANFILFPTYCKRMYALTTYFEATR